MARRAQSDAWWSIPLLWDTGKVFPAAIPRGSVRTRVSHNPCSFPRILYSLWDQTIHPRAATALPKPSTAPFGRGDKGPTTSWGLSLRLSKTRMVPGGSYSNNLPSSLSVHLQLCLRVATPPGHHSCHNSDTFFPFPSHAVNTLCIPKLFRRPWVTVHPSGMSLFSPSLVNRKKKKEGISLFRTRREARVSRCQGCALTIPQHKPTYSPGQKRGLRAREEVWLAAVPC